MTVLKIPSFHLSALFMVVVLCPPALASTLCGDDVDGQRVACSCGDTVVSSTRLRQEDPVVNQRCSHNGLQLRAAGSIDSLVLDLAGFTLTGSGSGTGILVLDGGSQGAVIVGGNPSEPGHVAGFRRGIRTHGRRGLKATHNLELSFNGDSTEVAQ